MINKFAIFYSCLLDNCPRADDDNDGRLKGSVAPTGVAAAMPSRRSTRHGVGPDEGYGVE
jgi:hypothetical protein